MESKGGRIRGRRESLAFNLGKPWESTPLKPTSGKEEKKGGRNEFINEQLRKGSILLSKSPQRSLILGGQKKEEKGKVTLIS